MSNYLVKEIFYSLQGEGFHTGRPAIFCRFSGCNLWNGSEETRKRAACQFCDTDFNGIDGCLGGKYTAESLAQTLISLWPNKDDRPFCVLTGGEPALQFDHQLESALRAFNLEIAIETNGTLPLKAKPDWLCVSPKGKNAIVITTGNELKLVWPQNMHPVEPEAFSHLSFDYFYLQPLEEQDRNHQKEAIDYCLKHPQWRLSLQTHKILDIQ